MYKVNFHLQTVTPLFLTGADGLTPELRVASMRGCTRFWLRALLGARCGANTGLLRSLESTVLGDTGTASAVTLRIRAPVLDTISTKVLPHSTQKTFSQLAFATKSTFTLSASPRLGLSALPVTTIPMLLLLFYLGGIGKRSRRGFGSLKLTSCLAPPETLDRPTEIMLAFQPDSGEMLATYLKKMLNWTLNTATNVVPTTGRPYPSGRIPDYPVLSPHHAKVLVCKTPFSSTNYLDAMEKFWQILRSNRYRDERAYGFAGRGERRASPLLLHIHQTAEGHHLVLTAFRSLPSPAGIEGWTRLHGLLEECRHQWQGEYVFGGGVAW
ncbi:MAG: type III-B CRISPR module RAMP protein Cmr1 [Caldilineaceae bacterium]